AVDGDAEIIAVFNEAIAWETEHKRLDSATIRAGVRALLADSRKGRYFVACVQENGGERVIGQSMHTWEWSDWRNGEIWWLQSVYVHADYRGRGAFRKLLTTMINEAKADPGVVGMRLYVENANSAAQAVYKRLGFA